MKSKQAATLLACLTLLAACAASGERPALPDFSGTWLPVQGQATAWQQHPVPLTAGGRERFNNFEPARHDSTLFCMPYGTPRNTLNTAAYPVEILQTSDQLTLVFDRRGDIRRVFLDGRPHPEDPVPSWMGHSVGQWDNGVLRVSTVAVTDESILGDDGWPHSDAMRVLETYELEAVDGEARLKVRTSVVDDAYYESPLTAVRYWRRVPDIEMIEGAGECLLDQWRQRLEQINRTTLRSGQAPDADNEG